jgi:N utilization substance protein B
MSRRAAREAAMKLIYEYGITGSLSMDTLYEMPDILKANKLSDENIEYIDNIIKSYGNCAAEIDENIEKYWPTIYEKIFIIQSEIELNLAKTDDLDNEILDYSEENMLIIAEQYYKDKEYRLAKKYYLTLIKSGTSNYIPYNNLACTYLKEYDYRKAEFYFSMACKLGSRYSAGNIVTSYVLNVISYEELVNIMHEAYLLGDKRIEGFLRVGYGSINNKSGFGNYADDFFSKGINEQIDLLNRFPKYNVYTSTEYFSYSPKDGYDENNIFVGYEYITSYNMAEGNYITRFVCVFKKYYLKFLPEFEGKIYFYSLAGF